MNHHLALPFDVLGNQAGIAFWRAIGFVDYALTMELRVA